MLLEAFAKLIDFFYREMKRKCALGAPTNKMMECIPNEDEVTTVNEETEIIPTPMFGDGGEPLQPAFNISDSRERCFTITGILLFITITLVIIGVTLLISGILYSIPDPKPNFTESYILKKIYSGILRRS